MTSLYVEVVSVEKKQRVYEFWSHASTLYPSSFANINTSVLFTFTPSEDHVLQLVQ